MNKRLLMLWRSLLVLIALGLAGCATKRGPEPVICETIEIPVVQSVPVLAAPPPEIVNFKIPEGVGDIDTSSMSKADQVKMAQFILYLKSVIEAVRDQYTKPAARTMAEFCNG